MNWFKDKPLDAESAKPYLADDRNDPCEHVEADPRKAFWLYTEMDSFGIVCQSVVCKECHARGENEAKEAVHECYFCKAAKPRKEGIMWRHWDFYAPQGDEEVFICMPCRSGEAAQAMFRRDAQEAREGDSGATCHVCGEVKPITKGIFWKYGKYSEDETFTCNACK